MRNHLRSRSFAGRHAWLRWALVAGMAGLALAAWRMGAPDLLSLDALAEHYRSLRASVQAQPVTAGFVYLGVYAATVAVSLPGAAVLTLAGGLLFGWLAGGVLAVLGATIGAGLVFALAKSTLGDWLRQRYGGRARALQQGFARDAFGYLLTLRLIPLFPFWLVNLAPAFLGVRTSVFLAATAIGIVPGTLMFALAGQGLAGMLESGGADGLAPVLKPELLAALTGLGVLSLVATIYRKRQGRARRGEA